MSEASRPDGPLAAAEDSLRSWDATNDLIVLPGEIRVGVAIYDDSTIDMVKVLRADGVSADFAHEPMHRSWAGKKSAELAIALIIGIASAGGWDALKALFRRKHGGSRVEAKVAWVSRNAANETMWQWFEFKGSGEEVAKLMDEALRHRGEIDGKFGE